jgi:hypothetical protein
MHRIQLPTWHEALGVVAVGVAELAAPLVLTPLQRHIVDVHALSLAHKPLACRGSSSSATEQQCEAGMMVVGDGR